MTGHPVPVLLGSPFPNICGRGRHMCVLPPGLANEPELEEGEEDNDIDDDKDSGNGSVLEYVPQSEFQVSPSSLFLVWD